MPKIIPNIREKLLEETKKQIQEKGYADTTMRSVAQSCDIGIGTAYNYFKSKTDLVASFVLDDWNKCLDEIKNNTSSCNDSEDVLRCMHESLLRFLKTNKTLFSDGEAAKVFFTTFSGKHEELRAQLAEILYPICANSKAENKQYLSSFIAESFLKLTISGDSFKDIYSVIKLLL